MKLRWLIGSKLSNYLSFACILQSQSKEAKTYAFETMQALLEGQSFHILTVIEHEGWASWTGLKKIKNMYFFSAYRKPLPKLFPPQITTVL